MLSLQLFDHFPTAYFLMNLWLNYRITGNMNPEFTKMIFQTYQDFLSKPASDGYEAMEHSLFFDLFQSPELQIDAWNYFLENHPSETFLKIMLQNAPPIPYGIKDKLYQKLMPNTGFHVPIYRSIRDSCTYTQGYSVELDKPKALKTVKQLQIGEDISKLDEERGRVTYSQILLFLSTPNAS